MREVECWCCQYFVVNYKDNHSLYPIGLCSLKSKETYLTDKVCEEFILSSGLYTKRSIPNYCKKYHQK